MCGCYGLEKCFMVSLDWKKMIQLLKQFAEKDGIIMWWFLKWMYIYSFVLNRFLAIQCKIVELSVPRFH